MNADGSGQTRLTVQTGYDGHPSWSPDGTRLAFASQRSGEDNIWIMNADGTGLQAFYAVPDSHRPVWSPDGTQIAFDADEDQDAEREIWRGIVEGAIEQVIEGNESTRDYWVRSWSNDGLYLAFTRVLGSGNSAETDLYAMQLYPWSSLPLGSGGNDSHPGWETVDPQPPTSNVDSLPPQSPGPFTVSWIGSDYGPSGLKNYDVQAKDLSGGVWSDWLLGTTSTSARFPGVGGQTYFFRSRARDNAGNVEPWSAAADSQTRVESCPPFTAVDPLPGHLAGSTLLHWSGTDQCGSALATYDVQFRDLEGGTWTDLDLDTRSTVDRFAGAPGHRYGFRSRGIDTAYNLEPWPPGDGDTTATFYNWSVSGQATNNAGRPVAGIAATTGPAADHAEGGTDGGYGAYRLAASEQVTVTWGKAGYGTLPETSLGGELPISVDVVLPPADNAVQDWGFEGGSLEPGEWTAGGTIPPLVTGTIRHTGQYAAQLGQSPPPGFSPPANVGDSFFGYWGPKITVDRFGAVHIAWSVGSTYPDLWVAPQKAQAEPGSQVAMEIRYGNRGAAPAEDVRLSAALPPELTFLSASLPPSSTVPTLTWDLGSLAANGNPYTLVITAAVAAEPPASSPLTQTAAISTAWTELELENNAAAGRIYVAWRAYLPLVEK